MPLLSAKQALRSAATPMRPAPPECRPFRMGPRCWHAAVGGVDDDQAGLRECMAQVPQRLRPALLHVVPLESVDRRTRLGGERDQRPALSLTPSAVIPCSAS